MLFLLALTSCVFSAGALIAQLRGYRPRAGITLLVSVLILLGALLA